MAKHDTGQSLVFGRRLREARVRAGLPQDKLGVMVGLDESCSSARISRYETDTHQPPYDLALRLADVLGIPVAYLYCNRDALAEALLLLHRLDDEELSQLVMQIQSKGSES